MTPDSITRELIDGRPRCPGLKPIAAAELREPGRLRLYRALVSEHSIHTPGGHPEYGKGVDHRMTVTL